jgi:NAD+ diphosphatase
MSGLPKSYPSPTHLPFNSTCLHNRFSLATPDADPGGAGYWLALSETDLLVEPSADGCRLPFGSYDEWSTRQPLFLGHWDGHPCRLVKMTQDESSPVGLESLSLVTPEPALPIDIFSLGGLARMVRHWEHNSLCCGICGQPMERLPGEWGKQCPSCRYHQFPKIAPCVIVLVQRSGEVLLTRKAEWAPNRYSLVAGFLDFGECLEEAVAREIKEETGVEVTNIRYLGSQCWPFPSQVMCGYVADYVSGEVVVETKELEDARWFAVDDLPALPPKRSIARYILDTVLGLS